MESAALTGFTNIADESNSWIALRGTCLKPAYLNQKTLRNKDAID